MAQITLNSSGVASNGSLLLQSNGTTTAVTIDTAQNMGLGVTPSATWSSSARAIQLGGFNSIFGYTSNVFRLANNAIFTAANETYGASSIGATYYQQYNGAHSWYNAASGTAGNAISFTQAMTLTSGGSLLVKTTTDTGAGVTVGPATSAPFGSSTGLCVFGNSEFQNALHVGGNLLVGTTSNGENFKQVLQFSGDVTNGFRIVNTATSGGPDAFNIAYTGYSPNNTTNAINFGDSTTTRFQVKTNGGISNYQANNVNLSDRREKTNFAPAKSYLDTICAIPVQTFNYIDQNLEEDPGLTLGVVAQNVQAVAPELVMESNWGTEEEPKMRLSIYQTDLQYALMKCIQEQQAIIQTLTDRITALEQA